MLPRMDINDVRRHIARVLVEGLLRRTGYRSARVASETGAELHDTLLVWEEASSGDGLRTLTIVVSYCPDVERAFWENTHCLRPASTEVVDYGIVVTDHPAPGRACFQAIDLRANLSPPPSATVDLHEIRALRMNRRTVEDHEELVKRLFPVLDRRSATAVPSPSQAVAAQA